MLLSTATGDHLPFNFYAWGYSVFFMMAGTGAAIRKRERIAPPLKRVSAVLKFIHVRFARIAGRISDPEFMVFDAAAIWFYFACILVFSVGTAAKIHGSSSSLYSSAYHHGSSHAPLAGTPKVIRSDEFFCHTPAILNQVFRADRFAVNPSVLGPHGAALLANVPVRHISTLFRPEFWSFFVLPADYAFAAYWQFKALILLTGVFTLLRLLTGSTFCAASGSLWYFFSGFTQWTYSWPSLLPDMVGLMCLSVVFFCYLTVGTNTLCLSIVAMLAAGTAIDFALCAYVPHLLPLFWAGVAIFAIWCVMRRRLIWRRWEARPRVLAFAASILIVAGVMGFVYHDIHLAIDDIARTLYPGHRSVSGGTYSVQGLSSHFFEASESESRFPPALGNICESSGFLWFAPAVLFFLMQTRDRLETKKDHLILLLCIPFLAILAWALLPIPASFGRLFGMDKGTRLIPSLGILNTLIVATFMSSRLGISSAEPAKFAWKPVVGKTLGLIAAFLVYLQLTNKVFALYFSATEVLLAAGIATTLLVLLLEGYVRSFGVLVVCLHVMLFANVNPIERGLSVFTSSDLFKFVHKNPILLEGKWLVYSNSYASYAYSGPGFLQATGCEVYDGLRYVPDVEHFSLFARRGVDPSRLNSLGYLLASPVESVSQFTIDVPVVWTMSLRVSPRDPILRELGIRYAAFDFEPSPAMTAGLTPLSSRPLSGFWLFRLP